MSGILRSRTARAGFIVSVLLVGIFASGQVESVVGAAAPGGSQGAGIRSSSLVGGPSLDALLARLEETSKADEGDLPGYFEAELGLIEGARDVRVNDGGNTVGYVVDRAPSDAIDTISDLMKQKGWLHVSLGNDGGATFVKRDGVCTWALVTCTEVGDATSVVYRCVVA